MQFEINKFIFYLHDLLKERANSSTKYILFNEGFFKNKKFIKTDYIMIK